MMSSANQARKETSEFRHKATLILAERGWTTCGIAECLGITERTVRTLRKQPCEALEVERQATSKREAAESYARTKQRNAPFDVEAYLANHSGGVLTSEQKMWLGDWKTLRTREKVRRYIEDGRVSQAQMSRLLGVSRPAVSRHVKELKQMAG